mgnify:CR=1 FL=1
MAETDLIRQKTITAAGQIKSGAQELRSSVLSLQYRLNPTKFGPSANEHLTKRITTP